MHLLIRFIQLRQIGKCGMLTITSKKIAVFINVLNCKSNVLSNCLFRSFSGCIYRNKFPISGSSRSECIFNNRKYRSLSYTSCAPFTSSSNPTQIPLLEEVEAKVLQVIKKCKPSLFMGDVRELKKNVKFQKVTEMVVCWQQKFGIQLSDDEALSIENIGAAIDIFFNKINARIMNKMVEKRYEESEIIGSNLRQDK